MRAAETARKEAALAAERAAEARLRAQQERERACEQKRALHRSRRQARERRAHNALIAMGLQKLASREEREEKQEGRSLGKVWDGVWSFLPQPVQQVIPTSCLDDDGEFASTPPTSPSRT